MLFDVGNVPIIGWVVPKYSQVGIKKWLAKDIPMAWRQSAGSVIYYLSGNGVGEKVLGEAMEKKIEMCLVRENNREPPLDPPPRHRLVVFSSVLWERSFVVDHSLASKPYYLSRRGRTA